MKYFFLVCVFYFSAQLQGQWDKVDKLPPHDIVSLWSQGQILYAASAKSMIYWTEDSGMSWDSSSVGNQDAELTSLFSFNQTLFAGTYEHGIYRSTDGGQSWQKDGGNPPWVSGFAVAKDKLYASTLGSGVFTLNANTKTWSHINEGLPNYSNTVESIVGNSNYLICSAGGNGTYYSLDFKTMQWNEGLFEGTYAPGLIVNKLANNGDSIYAASRLKIYQSIDAGKTWVVDRTDTHNGTDRKIFFVGEKLFTLTNTFSGTNGVWIQQRPKDAPIGSSWADGEHYIADRYAYDLVEHQGKLYLSLDDGLYVQQSTVGNEELPVDKTFLKIFPNPSIGSQTSVISEDAVKQYFIYSTSGQLIGQDQTNSKDFLLKKDLGRGLYFVQFELLNGRQEVKKWVVE